MVRVPGRTLVFGLPGNASGRLLEIGAASGYFLDAAQKAGFSVSGIEPVTEVAEQARAQFGIGIAIGFLEDIALEPRSLDVVCAWHVLEHLRDPADAVERVSGVLRWRPAATSSPRSPTSTASWPGGASSVGDRSICVITSATTTPQR